MTHDLDRRNPRWYNSQWEATLLSVSNSGAANPKNGAGTGSGHFLSDADTNTKKIYY
jgi:hypothetical protein